MKHTPLAELNLLDDFLFNALVSYPEYGKQFCKKFLKILFQKEFQDITITPQTTYEGEDTNLHGARLDLYVEEKDAAEIDDKNVDNVYDLEPDKNVRKEDVKVLGKRTRFYHAVIDRRSLKRGESYKWLKNVFVIFICPYDPLGDDRMIYTIKNHCVENLELPYEDGRRTIFLYTKGKKGRENKELVQLLTYMEETIPENAVTEDLREIQKMVDAVKQDGKVGTDYMKRCEVEQNLLEQGEEIGRAKERENTIREKERADAAEEKIALLESKLAEYGIAPV